MSFRVVFNMALILLGLYFLFTVSFSLVLAFLLAFLLEPIIVQLTSRIKLPRTYISLFVCTAFTVIIGILGYLLGVKVISETAALSNYLINITKDLSMDIDSLVTRYQTIFQAIPAEYQYNTQQAVKSLLASLQGILNQVFRLSFNLAKMIPNVFVELVITIIAMYLISLRLPSMKAFFLGFFETSAHSQLENVLQKLHSAIFGFIRAQLIISTLEFFFVFIGFLILGVNYPSATAFLVTIVDILPVLGTGAVMIPMSVYQYITGDTFLGIGLFVHYLIIIVFRRIIDPKIMADSIGISALASLASMYLGVKIAGFVGLFLGPAVVILFQAMIKADLLKIKIRF